MSTWHKEISKSLADSVSAVLNDMKEDQKTSQNKMMAGKKGKGEPAGQIKPSQELPEEDGEENGNGNGKKLDPVNKKAVKKKFDDRKDKDIDNDGDTDASDKFLHKKRKAITKAIRKTSRNGKKVDLSGKKEKVTVNPNVKEEVAQVDEVGLGGSADRAYALAKGWDKENFDDRQKVFYNTYQKVHGKKPTKQELRAAGVGKGGDSPAGEKAYKAAMAKLKKGVREDNNFADERAQLREALEASFDTVFQYSNKEEEAYRDQWMNEFDSFVTSKDPHAYIDPLQRKVLYIEGLTPSQAGKRYVSMCIANAALSGGEYQEYSTRGGDPVSSSQNQGQSIGRVHNQRHQVDH